LRSSALILLLCLILTACGKTNSHSKKDKFLNPAQMNALMAAQNIFCSDSEFCPEGVARMFAINFKDNALSSSCSAFLVAEDLVMTNSHCIWTGDVSLEETCRGLYFAFPNPHGQTQSAQCSKIMWRDRRQNGRDSYRKGDNDFALVKLDRKVSIRPLKLNSHIQVGQTVHPLVMDQYDSFSARVTKLNCDVLSINRYGVATLKDCPIISGNSGSAVLDANQTVVAVIFSSSNAHVRSPTDELELRTQGQSTQGRVHTIAHIKKILGEILNPAILD
jgi:V8-like Glu-specific endopeptidase